MLKITLLEYKTYSLMAHVSIALDTCFQYQQFNTDGVKSRSNCSLEGLRID